MATRHEIISIDFRANAAKANPAMDSLREAAKNMNTEIEKTKKAIDEGIKAGKSREELDKLGATLTAQEKKLKSFETAMTALSKGVGTLSRAIAAFNNGSLSQMSAAFQKASYNAAENAKKALVPGTKDYEKSMAELDALQQKNLENLAKYKLRTEQMLQSIAEGGKISSQDLKQEADGIQELMRLLPHMSHEWLEYHGILTRVNDAIKQQADNEKRLNGAIVDAEDARSESVKLTKEGAEAARQQREQAEQEIATLQKERDTLKENRAEIEQQIAATRELVAEREKALKKQEETVKSLEAQRDALARRKDEEHDPLNVSRQNADTLRESAQQQADNLELQKKKTKELGDEVTALREKIAQLGQQTVKPKVDSSEVEKLQAEIEALNTEYKKSISDWNAAQTMLNPHQTYSSYEEFVKKASDVQFGSFSTDYSRFLEDMAARGRAKQRDLLGDEVLVSPAYRDRKEIAKLGYDVNDPRLMEINEEYFFGAKEAKAIIEGEKAYEDACKKVDNAIRNAHQKLREAFDTGLQPEQVEGIAKQIHKLESLYLNLTDLGTGRRSSMMGSGKNIVKDILGELDVDLEKTVSNTETQIKRIMTLAEKNKYDFYDKKYETEREEALQKQAVIEKRQDEIKTELVKKEKELAAAQQQSTAATEADTEAIKKQEQELEKLERELADANKDLTRTQGNLEKSLEPLKQMGLAEEDLEDKAKLREAAEKKVLEIMEAQANVEKEVAEQQAKLIAELKDTALGGTKADHDFYMKNRGNYALENYTDVDDAMARITHLEHVSKLKNGKRFSDDTEWDPDNEFDLDEDLVMNDKEKQAALDELRILKQHVRETILKTIREVGDIDKAVEQETGGDGVDDDSKFGQQLNDKIEELKEKIHHQIKTTLESYEDILDDVDRDEKMSKEEVTRRVNGHIENLTDNVASDRDDVEYFKGQVEQTNAQIAAKKQLIEQTKQQTQAQQQSNDTDAETLKLKEQLKQKEDELTREKANETRMETELAETKEKSKTADEEAEKAERAYTDAVKANESQLELEKKGLEEKDKQLGEVNATLREQQQQLADNGKAEDENARKTVEAQQKEAKAQELSTERIRQAIKTLEEKNLSLKRGSEEWMKNERAIAEYNQELEETKRQSDALRREPIERMMTERIQNIGNISNAALQETKKFWQAMADGAERSDPKLKEIEQNLKRITAEEQKRAMEQMRSKAFSVRSGLFTSMDENELRESINAAREYQKTLTVGGTLYNEYSEAIAKAEKHLRDNSVETERAKLSQQEMNNVMRQQLDQGTALTESALKAQVNYWRRLIDDPKTASESLQQYKKNLEETQRLQAEVSKMENVKQADRLLNNGYLNLSEEELTKAIAGSREYQKTLQPTEEHYRTMSHLILEAENHLKNYGMEALRAANKQAEADALMTRQLQQGTALTENALKTQIQYWQRLADDPKAAAEAVAQYTANMEKAQGLLDANRENTLRERAGRLSNMDNYSVSEIRESIEAAKQLQSTYKLTDDEVKKLSEDIVTAETRISKVSVETERAAQKQREDIQLMEQQLTNGTALTESALKAQENYWRRLIDDPKTAAESLDQYKANLKEVQDLQRQQAEELRDTRAARLGSPDNFGNLSEQEIREAIEAGKQLIQTYETGDARAKSLGENIVRAEEHLKKYGVEAARTAQREADAVEKANKSLQERIDLMVEQWNKTNATMSDSAMKAHERFWQQLIDDPKTASESLDQYRQNLETVQRVIQQRADEKVATEGQSALDFFRGDTSNASADQIKEQAKALKLYRDSLPQKDNADLINEINGYIEKSGQTAKVVAGEMMSLAQAEELASKAGTDGFFATGQQMTQAVQAIERQRDALIKSIQAKRQNKNMTDEEKKALAEEEAQLEKVNAELKKMKFEMDNTNMSAKRMNEILDNPSAAKNIEELGQAVKRAQAQLKVMEDTVGNTNKEYQEMAQKTKEAAQRQKELETQFKASASAFDKAWSRLKTYVGLYVGASVAMNKLMGTIGDIHELSDRMGEVQKTTGFTADEVGRLTTNLSKLDVRTPLTQLMEVSAKAGTLGLKTLEDVQGFTEAANKLMIALPEMGAEAATEMMRVAIATGEVDKIRKQLQEGIVEGSSATAVAMEKIASTIDRLRASSASTAPEITDFVKRVGAVGAQSGITIDQVAALGSTVSSLGMRIEMSATALSRMIPAIRNNAFELSKAIGVTPDTIRNLFDTGRGMEVILMILQRIKDSGMDADSIEGMLGMAGMRDIMKDLNQQGARAGIVFSGLSQNVDELRRQLGVANQAYEENIAIQQEFDRMNETTAAKWERLKNRVEEFFVGDTASRWLGNIIDGMRGLVDFVMGPMGDAFKTLLVSAGVYFLGIGGLIYKGIINPMILAATGVHSLSFQVKGLAATWRTAWRSMDAATKATWIGAIASAVYMLGEAVWDYATKVDKLTLSQARLDNEEAAAERSLNNLMNSYTSASKKADEARKKQEALEEETKSLRDEVEKLRGSKDKSTEATERLNKKEEELKQKEKDLKKATDESNKANNERSKLISEINSKYGTYLGYLLDEKTAAEQVALAHWQIVDALKEELEQKRLGKKIEAIDEETNEGIDKAGAKSRESLKTLPSDMQQRITNQMNTVRGRIQFSYDDKGNAVYRLPVMEGLNSKEIIKGTYDELRPYLQKVYANVVRNEVNEAEWTTDRNGKRVRRTDRNGNPVKFDFGTRTEFRGFNPQTGDAEYRTVENTINDFINQSFTQFDKWTQQTMKREEKIAAAREDARSISEGVHANSVADADKMNADAYSRITATLGKLSDNQQLSSDNIGTLAQQANIITANLKKFKGELKDADKFIGKDNDASLENAVNTMFSKLSDAQRKQIVAAAKRQQAGGGTDNGGGNNGGWGNRLPADSTAYTDMTAEQLVNRRKQMNDFVKSIQTDTDVKAVLAEDKALMKAFKGRQATMREVVEWYNQQRLMIQDELHSRYLTNTGDWKDPKQQKAAHKQFKAELDAYLEELDAYYTQRKAEIERARTDEEITEGEAWRRNLKNENEWYNRRAELLKIYAEKSGEVTEAEHEAIVKIIAERTGESEEFVRAMIQKTIGFAKQVAKTGEKGAAMYHDWMADIDLKTQQSMLKSHQAITKQMKFIEDTLAKERPYDGITKNLQDNLDKMGVLAAQYRRENDELAKAGKEPKWSNEQITAQSYKEMGFFMNQVADAWTIDIDELLQRMVKEGMATTAEEISKSDMLKQAVMGQLRKTYQEVQDAVKKEASQIKKDVEIIWNDEAQGIGGQSMKSVFDQAIARLGMQQDSVSRANSLIGAGAASDNVATRLAIKQIEVQMRMQKAQFDMYRTQANQRMAMLRAEAKEHERLADAAKKENDIAKEAKERTRASNALRDAENVKRSLGLTLAEETKKEEEQMAELLKLQEESQNRLYTSLREWADLLTSSLQGVMEASHAGDAEYYNERAKLDLTGKGGPGAGTYIVIDNEGTSDARAHYEYLDERQALERQHEIERENAQAEAWKKLWDDLNAKMSEQITDWLNASAQIAALDNNTNKLVENAEKVADNAAKEAENSDKLNVNIEALNSNTEAVKGLTEQLAQGIRINNGAEENPAYKEGGNGQTINGGNMGVDENGVPIALQVPTATEETPGYGAPWMQPAPAESGEGQQQPWFAPMALPEEEQNPFAKYAEWSSLATESILGDQQKVKQGQTQTDKENVRSTQSAFAKMTAAANLYGIAYQAMSNDNLSTMQKFGMMAVQAAGQSAITALTVDFSKTTADAAMNSASVLGKLWSQLGWYAVPVYALFTGLLGGLMGVAASKIAKSKSEISQATGASVGAGRLSTGMLTYAEGNVNEFTDPASLTPGRSYNVDGADGKTYRARYMGKGAKTHITSGPEFHLVGEAGREAIIDAKTTRQIQMDEPGIWHTIQTLYNGGSITPMRRRTGRGVRAFADGNIDDFEEVGSDGLDANGTGAAGGMSTEMMASMQATNDRLADLLEQALVNGIKAVNKWDGPDGIPNMYNMKQKEAQRHGVKYL